MALHTLEREIVHFCKVYSYPCGITDIVASSKPIFREEGWEEAAAWATARRLGEGMPEAARPDPEDGKPKQRRTDPKESEARSMRRAKARVRRLAMANDFRWFVTLTLDKEKVDRYDPSEVVRKLNQWCSNQVKRKGLQYVLVPERHKDGAIHFHGFFNDALEAVPSGHSDQSGHEIFNFPGWTLGFTAGIPVYGDYASAVAYVCKYIGKQGDKPAGRWYYSGGELKEPKVDYLEVSSRELEEMYPEKAFVLGVPGNIITVVNGIKQEDFV